jgi:hypothetical protein
MANSLYGPDYGARNDKTAARLDELTQEVYRRERYADVTTQIYAADGSHTELKGAHIIVDGGYHQWWCMIEPTSSLSDVWLSRFSKRLESVRKPSSECVIGRVEKRCGILRQPFYEPEMSKIGDIVRVCLGLHNRYMRYHQLHTIGQRDSDWKAVDWALDEERIQSGLNVQNVPPDHRVNNAAVGNETHTERESEHDARMRLLVDHFRVAFQKKEIKWPKTALEARGHRRDERPLEGKRRRKGKKKRGRGGRVRDDDDGEEVEDEDADIFAESEDGGEEEDEPAAGGLAGGGRRNRPA